MANSPQAKKRARQNEARFAVNKARRSRIRTHLRKVEEAIAGGDQAVAKAALQEAQQSLCVVLPKALCTKTLLLVKCRAFLRALKRWHKTTRF